MILEAAILNVKEDKIGGFEETLEKHQKLSQQYRVIFNIP